MTCEEIEAQFIELEQQKLRLEDEVESLKLEKQELEHELLSLKSRTQVLPESAHRKQFGV